MIHLNSFYSSLALSLKNKKTSLKLHFSPLIFDILNACYKEHYLDKVERVDNHLLISFSLVNNSVKIKQIQRCSLSGRRFYLSVNQLKSLQSSKSSKYSKAVLASNTNQANSLSLPNLGPNKLLILSTPLGIVSHHEALKRNLGGEALFILS